MLATSSKLKLLDMLKQSNMTSASLRETLKFPTKASQSSYVGRNIINTTQNVSKFTFHSNPDIETEYANSKIIRSLNDNALDPDPLQHLSTQLLPSTSLHPSNQLNLSLNIGSFQRLPQSPFFLVPNLAKSIPYQQTSFCPQPTLLNQHTHL